MRKTIVWALCLIMTMLMTTAVFAQNPELTDEDELVYITGNNLEDLFEILEKKEPRLENDLAPYTNQSQYFQFYSPTLSVKSSKFHNCGAQLAVVDDSFCGLESPTGYMQLFANIFGVNPHTTMGLYDGTNRIFYYLPYHRIQGIIPADGVFELEHVSKYEDSGSQVIYEITPYKVRLKKFPYVTVTYNDEIIVFDQKPVIENGRTLVPLRAIFEKIGATVEWNGDTQTVTATKDDTKVSLTIDNTSATKNNETITLDVPAKIVGGRTLVPVRFIADCFGVDVQWDGAMQRVILTK